MGKRAFAKPSLSRRGVRQRHARLHADVDEASNTAHEALNTALGDFLLELVGWKYMSAQMAQKVSGHAIDAVKKSLISASARLTGVRLDDASAGRLAAEFCPDLDRLSRIGTSGEHSGNVNRDFLRALGDPGVPYEVVSLPLALPGHKLPKQTEQNIIWPHLILSKLGTVGGAAWHDRVCPSQDRLQTFWTSMRGHPNYALIRTNFVDQGIGLGEMHCAAEALRGFLSHCRSWQVLGKVDDHLCFR